MDTGAEGLLFEVLFEELSTDGARQSAEMSAHSFSQVCLMYKNRNGEVAQSRATLIQGSSSSSGIPAILLL